MRRQLTPALLALLALVVGGAPAWAQELREPQELPIKPALAVVVDESPCVVAGFGDLQPADVSEEDRDEADRLAGEASQAAILGDRDRARDLLGEAAELDPSSASIAYRLARALEEAGAEDAAIGQLCHYLALEPEGVDAEDVQRRIDRLAPEPGDAIPEPARRSFQQGIERFEAGAFAEAERQFSRALVEFVDWDLAYYNRGVANLRLGRETAGLADLERYLELRPEAEDREQVAARLGERAGPALATGRGYNASTALFTGLLVPGMGHFYTDRPWMGFLYLLGAGGSAAFGLGYEEVDISCRIIPTNGNCPAEEILNRETDRPYLVHGLVGAGVLTVLGAVHASLTVGGRTSRQGRDSSGLGFSLPVQGRDAAPATLTLEPVAWRGDTGIRAVVRVPVR